MLLGFSKLKKLTFLNKKTFSIWGVEFMAETGFLLIADISGYTEFVKLHNLAKKPIFGAALAKGFESHATTIVADLLETVIDAVEPSLRLNKLEGDAAFFFSSSKLVQLLEMILLG